MTETQHISPEEEIKKLEQQLEEKKRQLAGAGEHPPEEKEIFRKVLKEGLSGKAAYRKSGGSEHGRKISYRPYLAGLSSAHLQYDDGHHALIL